ncbi:MAG: hypothetical protein JWQ95_4967 [Sphaerisporangium sp.]|jgi:hypothetical protein|nr:hypothetical protein [Sphaerisporangium sp.]
MSGGLGWQRLARQLAPRTIVRHCCWYHRGDWHRVSRNAIRLVRAARRAAVPVDDIADAVRDAAKAEGMPDWERQALTSLVEIPYAIQRTRWAGGWRTSYVNGQHRSQAMLEAGVRRTITVDWIYPGQR